LEQFAPLSGCGFQADPGFSFGGFLMKNTPETGVREYARKHNRPLPYVYRLIWEGRLPARRVDGRWFIAADAVAVTKRRRTAVTHAS
jgi:hypothetical protein